MIWPVALAHPVTRGILAAVIGVLLIATIAIAALTTYGAGCHDSVMRHMSDGRQRFSAWRPANLLR